ncbi:MAG TPA: DUF456 family protein [Nostocaceae cyanobacterium]|nr:DUF456 family protein [Nostocaceae cyanobacterium]
MQIIYWLLIILMMVGVIGAVVPALPGSSLILIGVIVWGIVQKSITAIQIPLIVTTIVFLLSIGVDFLAGYIGAKQAGASKWGQIGAFVGIILGLFGLLPTIPIGGPLGPLIGILMGPLLGAIIGEYLYCRDLKIAIKAGIGIFVGTVVGNLIQGLLAIIAFIVFLVTTWPQVY